MWKKCDNDILKSDEIISGLRLSQKNTSRLFHHICEVPWTHTVRNLTKCFFNRFYDFYENACYCGVIVSLVKFFSFTNHS